MTMNPLNVKLNKTSPAQIDDICRKVFGIVGTAKPLASERDETILVQDVAGPRYVLKIANPTEQPEVLAFQTKALLHLAGKAPVPQVVQARNGATMVTLQIGGQNRIARMLNYLEGTPLHLTQRSLPQMAALGRGLAGLGQALADFADMPPEQDLLWDLTNAGRLRAYLPSVAPQRRGAVRAALDRYDMLAASGLAALPAQVIHNDFNPHNILMSPDNPDQIAGIIDFGDMVKAPVVCDLAVAMSYHLDAAEGLAPAMALLRAYHAHRPLSAAEIVALPVLLRMRLAMTLLITEWRSEQQPENAAYILRNHPACWAGLQLLNTLDDDALTNAFKTAVA